MMRVLVHWQDFPGYAADCVEEFRRRHDARVLVAFDQVNDQVEYRRDDFPFRGDLERVSSRSLVAVDRLVGRFQPDLCLAGGWRNYALKFSAAAARRGIPVVATSDNTGSSWIRRLGLAAYRRTILRHLHHGYWVPGRRARRYLEACGFPADEIREGMLSVRTKRYEPDSPADGSRRNFLFVGRLIESKGIYELLDAFRRYEGEWKLRICGAGPLGDLLEERADADGRIEPLGFVQPHEVAMEMKHAGALVLPSRREAWGVAILEGAAAGLPVVCTDACGASEDLVEDGRNGFVLDAPAKPEELAAAFHTIETLSTEERRRMGQRGRAAAAPYDATRWADTLFRWGQQLAA